MTLCGCADCDALDGTPPGKTLWGAPPTLLGGARPPKFIATVRGGAFFAGAACAAGGGAGDVGSGPGRLRGAFCIICVPGFFFGVGSCAVAGAGAELVERARLGPYARLVGTDVDAKAVAATLANMERAGVDRARISVEQASALDRVPDGVTLILTNPPMGRRVERGTHAELLERFVDHAAHVLVPGGALVWLVPEPRHIQDRAKAAGLERARAFSVDMGGFSAELGVYLKSGAKGRRIVPSSP